MPRDGSGNYTLPSGNPVTTGTLIQSSWANPTMSDIAAQLNNVITRDGVLGFLAPLKLIDGSAPAPALTWNSEPSSGIYRIGAQRMGLAANGLTIETSDASTANLYVWSMYPRSAGASQIILNSDTFGTANTTILRLRNDGTAGYVESVGVGSGVAKPLQFVGASHGFNNGLQISSSTIGNNWISVRPAGVADGASLYLDRPSGQLSQLVFRTGTSYRWRIAASTEAETGGNAGSNLYFDRFNDAGAFLGTAMTISRTNGVVSVNSGILAVPGYTYNTNTGAFGLTPVDFQTVSTTRYAGIYNASSLGVTTYCQAQHNPGVIAYLMHIVNGVTFSMDSNGTGGSPGGWVATSDRRYKSDITPIKGAMTKVRQINGCTFFKDNMKGMDGNSPRKAGYIAQEIEAVLPEAIVYGDTEERFMSVDHNAVIGLLIQAVKELDDRLVTLATAT